jgi:hypothetical protein
MTLAQQITTNTNHLHSINSCRIWLRTTSIAEITDIAGQLLLNRAISGNCDENSQPALWHITYSTLTWSEQPRPPDKAWKWWKKFLQHITINKSKRLRQPLGSWHNNWQRDRKWCFQSNKAQTIITRTRADGHSSQYTIQRRTSHEKQTYMLSNNNIMISHTHSPITPDDIKHDSIVASKISSALYISYTTDTTDNIGLQTKYKY